MKSSSVVLSLLAIGLFITAGVGCGGGGGGGGGGGAPTTGDGNVNDNADGTTDGGGDDGLDGDGGDTGGSDSDGTYGCAGEPPTTLGANGNPRYAAIPSPPVPRVIREAERPAQKDLSGFVPTPCNQGPLNSCVAWSGAYGLMTYLAATNIDGWVDLDRTDRHFSPTFVFNQVNAFRQGRSESSSCLQAGTFLSDLFVLLRDTGCVTWAELPYTVEDCQTQPSQSIQDGASNYRIAYFRQTERDVATIQSYLNEDIPVVVVLKIGEAFFGLGPGDVYATVETDGFAHAMLAVGYDNNVGNAGAIKIMNSWGTEWGDGGFAFVSYNTWEQSNVEAYVVGKELITPLTTPTSLAPGKAAVAAQAGDPSAVVNPLLDADGDGFPDSLEAEFGFDPDVPDDNPDFVEFPDADGDGWPDSSEEVYGTDPQLADDFPFNFAYEYPEGFFEEEPDDGGTGRFALDVVKLDVAATTSRGPAVGDGVLAFNTLDGTALAWLRAGETTVGQVPTPQGMAPDDRAFAFTGTKLVIRDRLGGSLYVFDTAIEQVAPLPAESIDLGAAGSPNIWATDGGFVATINAATTTQDGAGKRLKLVDLNGPGGLRIAPFEVDPVEEPDRIALDAAAGRIVVHGGQTLYVYDTNAPSGAPATFAVGPIEDTAGWGTFLRVSGDVVAFYDQDANFTVLMLNLATGALERPARNPARPGRGLALEGTRFAYFTVQNADDGSTTAQVNRALVGNVGDLIGLVDPAGDFVNGRDKFDGRVGFGATVSISPDGRFVFVGGETAVGVNLDERLYLSIDGGDFLAIGDPDDPQNALRAAGVAVGNNLVAFLIPADLSSGFGSGVSVGYATLPRPNDGKGL
ncbi:MAG TPA: C1 family peptidase [Phycisphaerae bacterium]|nr:C1 family peptidase [Phycisphaerae bacterium]